MPKYLSGRSKKNPDDQLSVDRYKYLSLGDAESNPGDPQSSGITESQKGSVIGGFEPPTGSTPYTLVTYYDDDRGLGTRYWEPVGGGLIPASSTVQDEGKLVGTLSSITTFNFVGSALTAIASPYVVGGTSGTIATMTVQPPGEVGSVLFKENIEYQYWSGSSWATANRDDFNTSLNLVFNSSVGILTVGQGLNIGTSIAGVGGSIFNVTGVGNSTIVGIGTTTALYNLHVIGDIGISSGTIYDVNNFGGSDGDIIIKNDDGYIEWKPRTSVITSAGGTIGNIQFHDSAGFVEGASDWNGSSQNASNAFVWDFTNHRVGLGSTQPSSKFDVIGDSKFVGFTTTTDLEAQQLKVSGISTFVGFSTFNDNVYIAGITTIGDIKIEDNTISTDSGNLILESGGTIVKVNDKLKVDNDTESTTVDSGALQVDGGAGINKNLNVGGAVSFTGPSVGVAVTLAAAGGITTTGGDLYIGGDLFVSDDIVLDEARVQNLIVNPGVSTFHGNVYALSKVGIGTTAPVGKHLTVGPLQETGTDRAALAVKTVSNSLDNGEAAIVIEEASGTEGYFLGVDSNGGLSFTNSGESHKTLYLSDTDKVGIGTDDPTSLLHLSGSAPRITLTDTAGTNDYAKIFSTGGNLYFQQRDGSAHGNIIFRTEDGSAKERLRIQSDGNVGINSSSPDSQLVVQATTDDNPAIALYRQSTGGDIASIGWQTDSGDQAKINYRGAAGALEGMQFYTGGASSSDLRMIIDHSGNVGIGTDDPDTTLHLDATDGAVVRLQRRSTDTTNKLELSSDGTDGTVESTNDIIFRAGGGEKVRILSTGRIGIGTDTVPRDMVHIHNPAANASSYIQFTNTNTAGTGLDDGTLIGISQNNSNTDGTGSGFTILQKENAEITLGTNNKERLRIASTGLVGIGTNNPDKLLTVGIGSTAAYSVDASNTPNLNTLLTLTNKSGTDGIGTGYYSAMRFKIADGATSSGWLSFIRTADNKGDFTFKARNAASGANAYPELMRIKSDGKVGINTSAPQSDLQVITAGSSNQDGIFKIGGTGATLGFVFDYDQGADTVARITSNPSYTNNNALLKICVDGNDNSNQLVLKGDGDVGIGTDNPTGVNAVEGNEAVLAVGIVTANTLYGTVIGGITVPTGDITIPDFINHKDNTDTKFGFPENDTFTVNTDGSERLRIDTSGNVGIGTTGNDIDSIGRALNIASSTGGAIYLQDADSPTTKFGVISYDGATAALQIHAHHTNSYIDLGTSGEGRLRITSDGRVLVGAQTETVDTSTFNSKLQVMGTDADGSSITVGRFSDDNSASTINLSKSRNTTVGNHGSGELHDNDVIGNIFWWGSDGGEYEEVAHIGAEAEAAFTDTSTPGALTFWTTSVDATEATERLRIDSSGTLYSYSPDDVTPNIAIRSNDTNWYGYLTQTVEGGTIASILSCGGKWDVDGTTYAATKDYDGSFSTGALVIHNQYNSSQAGAELVFLSKASGSSTTDGAVSERLRIKSDGNVLIGNTIASSASDRLLQIGKTDRNATYIEVRTSTTGVGGVVFSDGTADDSTAYRGTIEYDHGATNTDEMLFKTAAEERLRITSDGIVTIKGPTNANALEINTSSNAGSLVLNRGGSITSNIRASDGNSNIGDVNNAGGSRLRLGKNQIHFDTYPAEATLGYEPDFTERLTIDTSGVVRVGNTDSQTTSSNTKRIALGAKGSIWGWTSGTIDGSLNLADNYYWDGSNNKAIEADDAAYLALRKGTLRFGTTDTTPTAGDNIGLTEKFRITGIGSVGIGTTGPDEILHIGQVGTVSNDYNEGRLKIGGFQGTDKGLLIGYDNRGSGRTNIVNANNSGGDNNRINIGFGAITASGAPTTEVITINQSGDVGIGTNNPTGADALSGNNTVLAVGVVTANTLYGTVIGGITVPTGDITIPEFIKHKDDTDTKFGFPSDNTFAVNTSNSRRLTINSGGEIYAESGIATFTSSSSDTYSASQTTSITTQLRVYNTDTTANDTYAGIALASSNTNSQQAVFNIACVSESTDRKGNLIIQTRKTDDTYAERLRINPDGKVGIGTNNPQAKLGLHGSGTGTFDAIHITNSDTGVTGTDGTMIGLDSDEDFTIWHTTSGSDVVIAAGNNERLRIKSGGTVAIPAQGASNANPRLLFESAVDDNDFSFSQYEDSNGTYTLIGQNIQLNSSGNVEVLDSDHKTAGIHVDARNHGALWFLTGVANETKERFRINNVGDVGINTDTPGSRLAIHDGSGHNIYLRNSWSGESGIGFGGGDSSDGNTDTDTAGRISVTASNPAGKATGYMSFKTNSGDDLEERLRINNVGLITQTFKSNNSTVAEGFFINNTENTTGNNASIIFSNDSGNRKKAALAYIDTGDYGAGDLVFALDGADSDELHLTNDEKLRITLDGKVGINEDSPDALLHLKNIASEGIVAGIRLESSGTSNNAGDTMGQIEFAHNDGDDAGVSASIECSAEDNAGNTYLTFNNGNPDSVDERLRITSAGDVGIGTNNPTGAAALTGNETVLAVGVVTATTIYGSVIGDITTDGDVTIEGELTLSKDKAIHFRGSNANDYDAILHEETTTALLINSRNDTIVNIDSNNNTANANAHFAVAYGAATSSSTELFRIQEDGNVGIGTNNPTGAAALTGNETVLAVGVVTTNTVYATNIDGTNINVNGSTLTSVIEGTTVTNSSHSTTSSYADNAGIATNIKGGASNKIPYQTASSDTDFIDAPSGDSYLGYDNTSSSFVWSTPSGTGIADVEVKQYKQGTTERTCSNPISVTSNNIIGIGSTSNAYGNKYIQTAEPTGVCDGDIWYDPSDGGGSSNLANLPEIDLWTITADSTNTTWDDRDNDVLGGGSFGVSISRCTTTQNPLFTKQGLGMSYSSGVFTFPNTGTYEVSANLFYKPSESLNKMTELFIQLTTNNSSYSTIAKTYAYSQATDTHPIILAPIQLTVTNTSLQKIRFTAFSDSNNMLFRGATDVIFSSFSFKKLA